MKTSRITTLQLTVTAILMAVNVLLSSSIFSIAVPGGHLYINDIIIDTAAILLSPFYAFLVGGVGAFLGDFFFYPTPMFVSLVTHGLQAVVVSLCARHLFSRAAAGAVQDDERSPLTRAGAAMARSASRVTFRGALVGVILGAVIMVTGYSLGRAFVYASPAAAIAKLPFQILQASVGAAGAMILCFGLRILHIFESAMRSAGQP